MKTITLTIKFDHKIEKGKKIKYNKCNVVINNNLNGRLKIQVG